MAHPEFARSKRIRLATLDGLKTATAPPRLDLALPLAAERFAAQENESAAYEEHLAIVTARAIGLNSARILIASIGWVGLLIGGGFFVAGANPTGVLLLIASTGLLTSSTVGWVKFQHSDVGRGWIVKLHPALPSSIRGLLRGLRIGDGYSTTAATTDASLLNSAFAVLLCAKNEHVRSLVRGQGNPKCRSALTVTVEPVPEVVKGNHAPRYPSSNASIDELPGVEIDNVLCDPIIPPRMNETDLSALVVEPAPQEAPPLVQKFKYDWVRSLNIGASETTARVSALVFPAELLNPSITRAGLSAALPHLVTYPQASLADALAAAERSLEKTFKTVGKRDKAASAAWLGAMLKNPPIWLLEGMRRPTEPPPFGEILDFPIQFPPPKVLPGKSGTLVDNPVDEM
jgi:hypothetical protein